MAVEREDESNDASEDESSDEEYLSFDSDTTSELGDDAKTEEEKIKENEARAIERQRVLEAAGLIVTEDQASARPVQPRKRRTPPQAPQRHSIASIDSGKDLPPTPEPSSAVEPVLHVDDAFERYENFRKTKDYRLSVSSFDMTPPSPSAPTMLSATMSREEEPRHSILFSFLSRTKTPDPERPRLQISGPIPQAGGGLDTATREGSPAFGTSWASLVNKEALDGIPLDERKRQETIFELINTEAAYVRDLQLIVEVFYSSLMSILSSKEITVVFANVEDLLIVNTTFLSSLEERQKECRLYIDNIGDILAKHMLNMNVYMEYCVNHGTAIKILQSLRDQRPDLAVQLQRLRDDPTVRSLDLSSYLLAPMQRITRYPLLIGQILKYTQSETDKQQIEKALHSVESVLTHINENIREQEGRARLIEISKDLWIGQGRLDLSAPTRYMGPRKLLKEGSLNKTKSGRRLRAFLCNDILVLTDAVAKTLYRMPIPLSEVQVKEVGRRDDLAFRIVMTYPRGGDSIALRATSARDCDSWMKAIELASRRCREAERRVASRTRGKS